MLTCSFRSGSLVEWYPLPSLRPVTVSPAFELVIRVVQRVGREAKVLRGSATVKIMDEQMPLNHKSISDQRVLVTGGTRGLGSATTFAALQRGADVLAAYRGDRAAAAVVLFLLEAGGGFIAGTEILLSGGRVFPS